MGTKTWVLADPHFGHRRMLDCRPWDTMEAHDTALVDNWNSVVNSKDRVYVLGDLTMNRSAIHTVGRCNGRKILVKGNHDTYKLSDYAPYFEDIRAYVVKPKQSLIMSHIPIHPQNMGSRYKLNVHGHMHDFVITDDPRYRCVSMEQINYTPLDLMEILDK